MLYYLFRFLEQWGITGSHMWGYISFRALLALILSLVISAWFGEKFIKYLKSKQITETQRDASLDPFGVKKIGVPSMGGVIIILAILVPVLLLGRLRNIYLILMIITTVWLGFLGGMDDFIKIFKRDKEGLKGKYKIVGQVGIGLIVGLVLWASPDVKMNENLAIERQGQETVVKHRAEARKSLKTTIPFIKGHNLDYSSITSFCGEHKVAAGWILFVIMTIFVVTAVSNGANLNDGMDGMCAGNSAIIGVALGILAYVSSHSSLPPTSTSCIFQAPRSWWYSSVPLSEPSSASSGTMPTLRKCSWAIPVRSPSAVSSPWAPSSSTRS